MVAAPPELDERFQAPALSFSVAPASSNSHARSGTLVFMPSAESATNGGSLQQPRVIETPALIAYSRRGALPHLTRDNVARLPNEMVHLSLEHFMDNDTPTFTKAPFSLHRYIGLQETASQQQQVLAMGLRDPTDDSPFPPPTDAFLVASTFRGAVKVTPRMFLSAALPRPPDMLFAFGDDVTGQPTVKRLEKSVRRSLTWVAEVADGVQGRTNVFAPLVGSHSLRARSEYSKGLRGIVTSRATTAGVRDLGEQSIDDCICGYTLSIPSTDPASSSVAELLKASLEPLPVTKPRVAIAAGGPQAILRLVSEVGLDLFVDEWSSHAASMGVGLDFSFPVAVDDTAALAPLPSGKRDIGHSFFDLAFDRSFTPLSNSPLAAVLEGEHPVGPIPPTRAYVHHLLQAHEMTAHVILALHNSLVMHAFFSSIRNLLALGDGSFEREVERFLVLYEEPAAGEAYPCFTSATSEWGRVDKERGKGSLKDKLRVDAEEEQAAAALTMAAEQVEVSQVELRDF